MIYTGSGHRPKVLGLSYSDADHLFLVDFIKQHMPSDITEGISGMASGFDLAWARTLLDLGIPLTAAIPFTTQANMWPSAPKEYYRKLLKKAAKVHILYPSYKGNWQYYARDKWMVDNGDKVLCLCNMNIEKSGTKLTVEYAVKQKKPVINLWEEYNKAKARR